MEKLKTSLLPLYLIAVALVIGIGVLALVRLNQISLTVDDLTNELAVDRALSKDIISQILLTRFYANRYVRTQSQVDLDAFNAAFARLEALLAEADVQITHPQRVQKLRRIEAAVATYGRTFEEVTALVKRQQRIYAEVLDVENMAMENGLSAMHVDAGFSGNTDVFLASGNVQRAIYQVHLNTIQYLEDGNPRYAVQMASNYQEMLTALDNLEAMLGDSTYRVYIADMRTAAQSYYTGFETIRADDVRLQALLRTMFDELEPEISTTAAEMAASIEGEFQLQNATSQALIAQTRAVLLTTTAIAMLTGMGLAVVFSRYLRERLRTEQELRMYRDHLERMVEERTAELTQTNERLRQEVAERKRAEADIARASEALRESEASLARAQHIGHLGNWTLDYARNKVEWSDEMYRLLRLTPEDSSELTFERAFSRVHPQDRAALQAVYEDSVAQGKSRFETEFRTVPIDGQIRTHRMLAEIERDDDGRVTRLFGINIDITARKQAEEALRRSEENFRQIFEANPFPLMISRGATGEILMANQAMADHLGMPLDELVGSTVPTFYPNPAGRRSIMQELEERGKVTNRILRVQAPSDQHRVMLLNVIAIQQDGEELQLIGAADITPQVEAEEAAQEAKIAAEQANRAKSTFLASMSHELRTPLSAVLGFTEMMANDPHLTEEQRENLEIIGRNGEHLLALINDVLDLSKIEAGKVQLQPEVFDLHEMLLGLGEMFSLRAEQKGVTVVFDFAPNVPRYVHADVGKLRQVLINLLGNAVKFTEQGGVTMRVSRDSGPRIEDEEGKGAPSVLLHFEIKDTGVGIATDELERVFEAFEQTESGQRSKQGTGLGLPISREYVRMMGGALTVTSQIGVGSCFSFDLPVEVVQATEVRDKSRARRVVGLAPGQPTYKLLVVDDVEASRHLLLKLLRPLGFEMRVAVDGQQALDTWQTWQPDLVFMDMRMPVVGGREAIHRIRALPQGQETVIIALTAGAFEEQLDAAPAEGYDDFIRKPFLKSTIFAKLKQHLGVHFVHQPLTVDAEPAPTAPQPEPSAAAFDPQWTEDMRQAAIEGDLEWIERLVTHIEPTHPVLAKKLTGLAANFAHDEILHILENTSRDE